MPVAIARHLSKHYLQGGQRVVALDDVCLEIEAGSLTAIVGESGSGKTTLLSLMGALDLPTSGSVELVGHDLNGLSERQRSEIRRRHVGFVFQDFCLVRHTTAWINAALPLWAGGRLKQRDRARELLERFGLENRLSHKPVALSRGEMQRVALARALMNEPDILLADEPTGNLDHKNSVRIWDYLESLRGSGVALVVATHDREFANRCDRIIELHEGRNDQNVHGDKGGGANG